ncbi:MAG: precorrin-6y C5,15-methyltransferase (decarboxylating) subunit CbiE [Prochlorothrix sp.]|nr:precorrin-6y C5,15-methyltransferase (decarboxylating) subunit CbiE [Prochlorothrix sp.]
MARTVEVIGVGLEGSAGWSAATIARVQGAAIVVGSDRQLALIQDVICPQQPAGSSSDRNPSDPDVQTPHRPIQTQIQEPEQWVLGALGDTIDRLKHWLMEPEPAPCRATLGKAALSSPASAPKRSSSDAQNLTFLSSNPSQNPQNQPSAYAVVLTSGDPLFFGLGRLLLASLPPACLQFRPHPSSIQLAFSRLKLPWQDAHCLSVHGRDLEILVPLVQQGASKLAILTDPVNSPGTIAQLLLDLDWAQSYTCYVCENLGGSEERVTEGTAAAIVGQTFASLSVLVLLKTALSASSPALGPSPPQPAPPVVTSGSPPEASSALPLFGLPDSAFASFPDRPGLITKREIRVQILSELALAPPQVIWDIGAGTGSVSVEIARLCPASQIYAIEKTAAGVGLIQTNCDRFGVNNVTIAQGKAPQGLEQWPQADRVFIGGSGGNLAAILDYCMAHLRSQGRMILALATLEHQMTVQTWLGPQNSRDVQVQWRQVRIDRSASFAHLTRYVPLNPVTLVTVVKESR